MAEKKDARKNEEAVPVEKDAVDKHPEEQARKMADRKAFEKEAVEGKPDNYGFTGPEVVPGRKDYGITEKGHLDAEGNEVEHGVSASRTDYDGRIYRGNDMGNNFYDVPEPVDYENDYGKDDEDDEEED